MLVRCKSVALAALLPALTLAVPAVAAPRKPKKPAKKTTTEPAAPAPGSTPTDTATDKDKAAEPASTSAPPAASPSGGGGGGGGGSSAASAGGGAGSTSPAADASARPADGQPDKPAGGPDVDSLRQEYLSLRDELFKSRARANAVASQLYSTRVQIKLTYTTGRYYNPAKSSIRLDGANVYEDATGAIAGDDGIRFDGYVAPGRHLITFHVEATGKDDDSFTSTTESQIVVKAVAGKDLVVAARAKDSGDIAYAWKRTEKGSYGLGIDVAVKTAKLAETAPLPAATSDKAPGKGAKK